MGRSTQFIGLTEDAEKWVEQAYKRESYAMTTGMFDEPIPGNIYFLKDGTQEIIAKEVVQAEPWSSGPMIFTCLEVTYVNDNKTRFTPDQKFFEWVYNPECKNEQFDQKKGVFFV